MAANPCAVNALSTAWSEATERDRQTGAHGRHVRRRSALTSRAAGVHGRGARLSREALCGRRSTFGTMCRSGLRASHRRNAFWPPTNTIKSTPWRSKVAPPIDTTSRKAGVISQVAHLRCTHRKQAPGQPSATQRQEADAIHREAGARTSAHQRPPGALRGHPP